MYTKDGEKYFIVDAHIALWDARPENQRNVHGKQFIDCFYDYHRNLSPESEVWPYQEYLYQGGERLMSASSDQRASTSPSASVIISPTGSFTSVPCSRPSTSAPHS